MKTPIRIEPGPGQESVWDYPRPPRVETVDKHIYIAVDGHTLADTKCALRVLETSHPPVYYLPRSDVDMSMLEPTNGRSLCEWKGWAEYFDLVTDDILAASAAWTYPDPPDRYESIRDHIAFHAAPFAGPRHTCTVDGEDVTPQPGGFYGGWITEDIVGPFKGDLGTWGW